MRETIASPDSVVVSDLQPARASSASAAIGRAMRKTSGPRRHQRAHGRHRLLHVVPLDAVVRHHADAPAFVEAEDALATQTDHQLTQVPALSGEKDQVALR